MKKYGPTSLNHAGNMFKVFPGSHRKEFFDRARREVKIPSKQ
jgi:hypothetical protein